MSDIVPHDNNPLAILDDPERLNKIDADKVAQLWAIKKEMDDRDAKASYIRAFHAVQNEMTAVPKRAKAKNGVYAHLDDLIAMLDPLREKHGFAWTISEEPHPEEGWLNFVMELAHEGGHSQLYRMSLPVDGIGPKGNPIGDMNRLQGVGSSHSYARRYLKCSVFDVLTVDDLDGNMPEDALRDMAQAVYSDARDAGDRKRLSHWMRSLSVLDREKVRAWMRDGDLDRERAGPEDDEVPF